VQPNRTEDLGEIAKHELARLILDAVAGLWDERRAKSS
jgi:hypothetical protein